MIKSAILGFPRIGSKRQLKKALEAFWKGEIEAPSLEATGADLRAQHWHFQKDRGIDIIPSNDFSFYDQVLDMTLAVGAIPPRFKFAKNLQTDDTKAVSSRNVMEEAVAGAVDIELDQYFAMARGTKDAHAMEMTKWFDTNYHYIVPEFYEGQSFKLTSRKAINEFNEAKMLGIHTRPVLIGPVTYLMLGKVKEGAFDPLSLLDKLLPVYAELLEDLKAAGADWVQIDEPVLALDLSAEQKEGLKKTYHQLSPSAPKIMLASYFGGLGDNLDVVAKLPVAGHHVDLVRGEAELDRVLQTIPEEKVISLGVIDGRNIWRADLSKVLEKIEMATGQRPASTIQIAPSCSLLHCPVDLDQETKLDSELKSWMAFSVQKLEEIAALTLATNVVKLAAISEAFQASNIAAASRARSKRIHNESVVARAKAVTDDDLTRQNPFVVRHEKQTAFLTLPTFPTTTIGSFPQTKEIRKTRAAYKRGDIEEAAYNSFLRKETEKAVLIQEELGIDVLVHGEFERNDMVEYFGEQLNGFAFTKNGWVQSYGSRCVKPPVIYGDVSRPHPMTVEWSSYAQSLTTRPMKGMLTGPVTILQWSFVRDDQPRSETCMQIALAIRDEVLDLEKANIRLIQIDEPALREGLPLRKPDWDDYLAWAVDCFRLAAAGVTDETQIHTHMCYCEFNDIMSSIAALDADVISIETSRSDMELLDSFTDFEYPNEIGPGVYDIHAPRCPDKEEITKLLHKATMRLKPDQIWVNPDCGLKTRRWEEVIPALENMVAAAKEMRDDHQFSSSVIESRWGISITDDDKLND
jgi:5-methyltetrahydropteroyltriglutamate--homocysteine methyltransferase